MVTPLLFSTRLAYIFIFLFFIGSGSLLIAEDNIQTVSSPKTRTVVADFLMVDGDLYIVRGERGEIQIEVTPDTKLSEKFAFGDRIKAVLLPNDVAQIITPAAPDEPIGITTNEPSEPPPPPPATETSQPAETAPPQVTQKSKVRVIIADLLMVDGSFYIVRSEYGEIQIEITPKTDLSEDFKFGDKIKARVTSTDKALSVVRAGKDEPTGIQEETAPPAPSKPISPVPTPPITNPTPSKQETPEPPAPEIPSTRIIVADVLMVDGDFYIVRGERGEIRIEVTPKTTISESFAYGDRIKAEVLPNDKALTIERASPDDPIGITTP
jgi:exosome complex RNA-binding protein Csl4